MDVLFYHPNLPFNVQHMLVGHGYVKVNAHVVKLIPEQLKLTIHENALDLEPPLGINCTYLHKPLEYGCSLAVLEV